MNLVMHSKGISCLFTSLVIRLIISDSVSLVGVASAGNAGQDTEKLGQLRGHRKPLGEQRPSEGIITEVDGFLDPEIFYKNHVLASKPVLFKGAAYHLPAFQRWSDTYLNENYGSVMIEVEHGKKEQRKGHVSQIPMSQFLTDYKTRDIYMVQDVVPEMLGDFILPQPLQCGGFKNLVVVAVIWFSSGGTKSVLHNDDMDNINCLLDGEKSLVMIDKQYHYLVEDEHYVTEKTYSKVDVESVDLEKHPGLADVPWWEGHMKKGDCLYIPFRWYHTVSSTGPRNLAVNLWFSHMAWFNETDCVDCCKGNPLLSQIPMGESMEQVRHDVFWLFEGYKEIRLEEAVSVWQGFLPPATVQELFEVLDLDKDLVLSWEEVFSADIDKLIQDFPELVDDGNDEAPRHDEL